MLRPLTWHTAAALAVSCMLITGCSAPTAASPQAADGRHRLSVVASTDVYGDIAAQVAGDRAQVTSLITDPSQDPHSYQATVPDRRQVSRADLIIVNGGGYDDFMTALRAGRPRTPVLDVVALSGHRPDSAGELNEHVWYDLKTAVALARALAGELTRLDPADAAGFGDRAAAFEARLGVLQAREAALAAGHRGTGVAITEPVPLYLLLACGLVNRTPTAFSSAVEEESDVAPRVLAETLALFTGHRVALLAYNSQTSGPASTQVIAAARAAGVPVLAVTETLPAAQDYLAWMSANLDGVQAALGAR